MSFGSNVKPKRFGAGKKPEQKPWDCGCGIAQPKYLLFCKRCGKGQS